MIGGVIGIACLVGAIVLAFYAIVSTTIELDKWKSDIERRRRIIERKDLR